MSCVCWGALGSAGAHYLQVQVFITRCCLPEPMHERAVSFERLYIRKKKPHQGPLNPCIFTLFFFFAYILLPSVISYYAFGFFQAMSSVKQC